MEVKGQEGDSSASPIIKNFVMELIVNNYGK